MEHVTELYTDEDILKTEKKQKRLVVLCLIIGVSALIFCIVMCIVTNTKNAVVTERAAEIVFILAGWIVLYLFLDGVLDLKKERIHAKMLKNDERKAYTGTVHVDKDRMKITGSIAFYPVRVEELQYDEAENTPVNETEKTLRVIDKKVRSVRELEGKHVKVYAANGYVAAWEVCP